jgi:hypothetical protein
MSQVLAISNPISINANECCTKILKYKDDGFSFDFDYPDNPTFYQEIRIGIDLRNVQPVIKEKVYRQTNGKNLRGNTFVDKQIELHTDQVDYETHLALAIALKHTEVIIDTVSYFMLGDYTQDFNEFDNMSDGKAVLLEQEFNQSNFKC